MGLITELSKAMAREGKSRATVRAYSGYIRRLWYWAQRLAPGARSLREVTDLQWVAIFDALRVRDRFSPTSISGHMCALKYAYTHVYGEPFRLVEGLRLPRRVDNVRVLPHDAEIQAIFQRLKGIPKVVLSTILGTGMRIEETCKLRIHQIDLIGGLLYIKRGKGQKDRVVPISPSLIEPLQRYLEWRYQLWENDVRNGCGEVELPHALGRKFRTAHQQWEWQWAFPSSEVNEKTNKRWYISPRTVQRAMCKARKAARIARRITPHHLRHAYAAALKRHHVDTVDISTILGHKDVETTKRYIHAEDVRTLIVPDAFGTIAGAITPPPPQLAVVA